MEFDLMFSQGEKLFQTYSFFVWNPATEIWERRVEMRELLCRLVSLVKGSLEDKVGIRRRDVLVLHSECLSDSLGGCRSMS
jgi:hypothetical protein